MSLGALLSLIGLLVQAVPTTLRAEGAFGVIPPATSSFSLVIENDLFTGEDSQYTSGVAAIAAYGPFRDFRDGALPSWLGGLAARSWLGDGAGRQRARVYNLVQTMQTPEDITVAELQPDDLPYAGLLGGGVTLYAFDERDSDRLSLTLGVVGPLSLAEESQRSLHEAIGSDEPMGWDNQLDNEPVFIAEASRGRRLLTTDPVRGVEFDAIGLGGGGVGTLSSYLNTSLVVRVGRQLVRTHAVASLLPNRQVNPTVFQSPGAWYAFLGAEYRHVLNDLLVEGNTFEDSHSLELEHSRERLAGGVSVNVAGVGLSFVYADVPGNGSSDAFGSVSLTWLR